MFAPVPQCITVGADRGLSDRTTAAMIGGVEMRITNRAATRVPRTIVLVVSVLLATPEVYVDFVDGGHTTYVGILALGYGF